MSDELSFGRWLQRRRRALDLTQKALAQRVGCAPESLRKIEADARRPSRQVAERLADALELPAAERTTFVRVARAELSVDRLAPPSHSVAQVAFVPPAALPTGTVTFLFTDIEGSTQLWEQHPAAMQKALARHNAIALQVIDASGGVIFKSTGDGVCAAFARAAEGLAASIAMQHALQDEEWGVTSPLRVRIALHTGAAEMRVGDYLGPPLNRVARVMAVGHGGQILLTRAAQELVCDDLPPSVELRDLGMHRLKDLTRPEQIFQVVTPDLPADFPPLNTLDAQRHNLPVQLTPLIDRDAEVASVCDLLRHPGVRLVTLTGTGGVGKTRLALQVAAGLLDAFPDGVYFVPLAPVSDPTLVGTTIAQTLGIDETGNRPLIESLGYYLRDKQLLLLLDNFEQVVTAALFVGELLAAAPQIHILVTSREVLRLRGEKEFVVAPLALPDPKHAPMIELLSQYAAVQLFLQQALSARPDFTVTDANAPAVAGICHRLDGLPLAIELAATQVKLFTPEALLTRLARPLPMLTRGARDLPARQQTMRNTIAWSYNLLDAGEKALFRRLAVFVGGCTVEAAEAICNGTRDLPFATLDGLVSLVDKNLLQHVEVADGSLRFMMLETIGEYALERLDASGQVEAVRRRHAQFYLQLAEQAEPELRSAQQENALKRLESEQGNLRAVLQWAFDSQDGMLAAHLGAALWRFWYIRNRLSEGSSYLEQVLGALDTELSGAERTGARETPSIIDLRAKVLYGAGVLYYTRGNYALATTMLQGSLDAWRQLDHKLGIALSLNSLGRIAREQGTFVSATVLLAESLALVREVNDSWWTVIVLFNLGLATRHQGDMQRAAQLFEECLALGGDVDNRPIVALTLKEMALIALEQGDEGHAAALCYQSLKLCREIGDTEIAVWSLECWAMVAMRRGHHIHAARLLGVAEAHRETIGAPLPPADLRSHEQLVTILRTELPAEIYEEAWASGRMLSLDLAIAQALSLV